MKAEELMIGDWVCTEHDSTPRQIDWTRTGEVGLLWNKIVTPPYLVPIPITPEILEKNGFRLTKADTVCPADRYWWAINGTRDGAMVEITIYNPDVHGVKVLTKIHTQSSHESGVNTVHSCDIESVHELQHALRLCGIDKTIEL